MLHRENFRGRHKYDLIAVFDDDGGRFERDDCFSAAYVAFEQAAHGRVAFEVRGDFRKHTLLRRGRLEWKNFLQRLADFFFAHLHENSSAAMFSLAAHRQAKLIQKKFLENHAHLRGAAKFVQQVDVNITRGKMNAEERIAPRRKSVALQKFRRKRVGNFAVEFLNRRKNKAPQHARTDFANRFVDRHDAAHFCGVCDPSAAGGIEQFVFRIDHFHAQRAIGVHGHFSVQDERLAGLEFAVQIAAVEEAQGEGAAGVLHTEVKHGVAAAGEADEAAAFDFGLDGGGLAGDEFGDAREVDAVFVAKRQIGKEMADGGDAALGEQSGALGLQALQVGDWRIEGQIHDDLLCRSLNS